MLIPDEDQDLRIGTVVGPTQRIVILSHKIYDRVPGDCYATWIVIAHKPSELHPYVVWNVTARPDGFHPESGTYCSTIKEALKAYELRGGK